MTGRPPTPEHVALSCSRCGVFVAWAFPPVPPVAVVGACCAAEPVCVCPPGSGIEECLETDCPACDSVPVDRPCRNAEPATAEMRTATGRVLTDADVEGLAAEAERGYAVSPQLMPAQGPGDYSPAVAALVDAVVEARRLPDPAYLAQERGEAP